MTENGNGTSRIQLLNGNGPTHAPKTDDHGRRLTHNATVEEAHQISVEEGQKMYDWYFSQLPPYIARMIHDGLVAYGLIQPGQMPHVPNPTAPASESVSEPPAAAESSGVLPVEADTSVELDGGTAEPAL